MVEVKGGSDLDWIRISEMMVFDRIGWMGVTELYNRGKRVYLLLSLSKRIKPIKRHQDILSDWKRFIRMGHKIQSPYSTKRESTNWHSPAGAADQFITQIFPH
jgi:hypothetical protein